MEEQEHIENKELFEASLDAAQNDMSCRQIMEASNDERQRYSRIFRRGFKAGVEWDRRQVMKESVAGEVESFSDMPFPEVSVALNPAMFKVGDKVRIIVIKED